MTTYYERANQMAATASVMVQVCIGANPGDLEFVRIWPRPANADVLEAELLARWPGRGLRAVGFVGLVDMAPQLVLSRPLDNDRQAEALATAFAVYVATLAKDAINSDAFADEMVRAEVAELQRLYAIPDYRIN